MNVFGLFTLPNWILLVILLLVLLYLYGTWTHSTWADRGIPFVKPLPFIGTFGTAIKEGLHKGDYNLVKKYGKFFGAYEGRLPVLMVSDPEIIKEVTVKNALDHFPNRIGVFQQIFGELMQEAIMVKRDEEWKTARSILTPTFTATKMKKMMYLIKEASKPLMEHLDELAAKREQFEAKKLFGTFTLNVIASTMFGIQIDSQNNPNSDFVKYAEKAFTSTISNSPAMIAAFFLPFLLPVCKLLDIAILPKDSMDFFGDTVTKILELRREGKVVRNDFLQLMINAHEEEGSAGQSFIPAGDDDDDAADAGTELASHHQIHHRYKRALPNSEILANAVIFFLAGYETTATAISWLAYVLATKPDIQEKLLDEVDETVGRDRDISYESINKMEYLDMVWCEALRMYPPAERFDRECSSDCTLSNGYEVKVGDSIVIPVHAIHMDPDNFPDPENFDPERFSTANKKSRNPYSYCPFGLGPRSCIGMRFAVMEGKFAVIRILQKFKFMKTDGLIENLNPIYHKFNGTGITYPESGLHLKVERR